MSISISMSYEAETKLAVEAVIDAMKLCEYVRRDIPTAMEKIDKSPVTVADFGSQALICRAVSDMFPDDPIVAEEDAVALGEPGAAEHLSRVSLYVAEEIPGTSPDQVRDWINRGNGEVAARFWTLDPVDGTKGFLRNDQYAVALSLIEDGDVKIGVLGCPAMPAGDGTTGVLYVAVRGQGSFIKPVSGGAPSSLRVAGAEDAENLRFVESVESSHSDQERQAAIARAVGITAPSVRMDSQAKYGVVASGQAALYLRLPAPDSPDYRENIWDHAAGSLIVEEADGRVTDMQGNPLEFTAPRMMNNRGVIVSNGVLHERVIEAIND